MKLLPLTAAAVLFSAVAGVVEAGTVNVKGVHLCCGACVRDVNDALTDIKGVSDVAANRDAKIVTFTAADEDAAKAGVKALAEAGFHGKATHGDDPLPLPPAGKFKKGAKAPKIVFSGVHLCCGGCVNGAKEAMEEVKGVASIEVDRTGSKVTLSGDEIDIAEAVKALNDGGFHGTIEKE